MTRPSPEAALRSRLDEKLAAGAIELPPFPAVARKVVSLAGDPEAAGAELAGLVHQDAGLAAAVLRAANSAALSGGVRIVSLQQAVARLGAGRIGEIALAAALRQGVFDAPRHAKLLESLWRESLATALFAKEIARTLRESVESAFLCGLLRRVGRLLALRAIDGEAASVSLEPGAVRDLVTALDAQFGRSAAECWDLPGPVAATIRDDTNACALVRISGFAEGLAAAALDAKAEPPELPEGEGTDAGLNLYPEDVDALWTQAPSVLARVEEALA